ncbi:MAG: 4Fe-4S dicluster domain-containing protein [Promethearchaeota archaeon]
MSGSVKNSKQEITANMIKVYIMGQGYEVPEGLTIMKAMEYAGYLFMRGAGCRAGFCGACGTVYRLKDDYHLQPALACQTAVEDGMVLAQIPFVPAKKALYDINELKPEEYENPMLVFYPEIARCVSCSTCNKACPQDLEVMDYIQAALRGDIEETARLSFDCLQCGLCSIRCPAEIKHYHVGQLARRLYGKYMSETPESLDKRVDEVEKAVYDKEVDEWIQLDLEDLKKTYSTRDMEGKGH